MSVKLSRRQPVIFDWLPWVYIDFVPTGGQRLVVEFLIFRMEVI